ncbi:MAG TPA: pilus assembly protein N-terminal domain-containing protein [Candidatus Baltobacteraceae bacterium]|nr:pilus assembly protein N-terminal domain-containing protein [Candidatus Baltobacteraceae bacterium]
MFVTRLYRSVMALMCMLALSLAQWGPASAADRVELISLQSGHSVILSTPGLQRLAVGDGTIAGVVPLGGSQLVINGKAPGHTTVFVWAGGHRATYEVTVTAQQVDDLAQMLRTSLRDPNVEIVSFGHSVVVRGTVRDGAEYQQINEILQRFDKVAEAEKYTVVNAVVVAHPLGDLQRDIANIPGASDIRVDPDGKGNVIVSGRVRDAVTEQAILQRARGIAGQYLASDGKLIDRISTDRMSQIDIKVYVLEIDNTAAKNLGIQLQSAIFQPNGTYLLGPPSFPAVENPVPGGKALTTGAFFRTITLAPTLNLLLQEGHARILSAPDLVTTPGNQATFLVGGSFPIPYSTGLGQVSIQYKDYGVQLNVTPQLLGNGAVEAKISPNVSDLDFSNAVTENGFLIPALRTSTLATDVITQPGESIVMGGMLRRLEQRTIQKVPILGDIPILGQLFRSTNYQNQQSDVVFVMTPDVITR